MKEPYDQLPSDFVRLMYSRFFLNFSGQVQAVALGWQMYVLTKNPLFLGFIGLAEAVPAIGLALYSGYLVDKSNPMALYRGMIVISLISAVIMLFSQLGILEFTDRFRIGALFVSSFLTGAARSFAQPSVYAIVPRLIPRRQLPTSSAWMAMVLQIARIAGPACGGILFAFVGVV